MSESTANARAIPVLAALAFVAGVVFWAVRGAEAGAPMFLCSAVGFAVAWFFATRVTRAT